MPLNHGEKLRSAIGSIPPGSWAVGVSGGADSVALLMLLYERNDLRLHVVHLNHETRGAESDADAAFVARLAASMKLPCTIARLGEVAATTPSSNNDSARYRAARLALIAQVVKDHGLFGVILAHHADDQAETVLQRLLRGAGPTALGGIRRESRIGELLILRPLLGVHRSQLRGELQRRGIGWREDASNASPRYLRNRLRGVLDRHPHLLDALLQLGEACAGWRDWLDAASPLLADSFEVALLRDLPDPLAHHAARRWLRMRGADPDELTAGVCGRLLGMARDAATPHRQHFPGRLLVRRQRGKISAE